MSRRTQDQHPHSPRHFAYGTFTPSGRPSQWRSAIAQVSHCARRLAPPPVLSYNPRNATPQGLHTTGLGSSPFARRYSGNLVFDFFSCRYLDGSVPCVFLHAAMYSPHSDRHHSGRVTPFGYPRIIGCLLLPEAFRSLPRPSSSNSSKASTVDPFSLDHIFL